MNQEIVNRNRVGLPATTQYIADNKPKRIWGAMLYALVFIVLAAGIYFVFGMIITPGATAVQTVLIPAISFMATGILFAALLYNRLGFLNKLQIGGGLQYAMIVFTGVFATTFLIGMYKKNGTDSIITCLFYSCLFLLPYIIYQTWIFYSSMTASIKGKVWHLPEHTSHVPVATVFLNSIRINIKIAPTPGEAERVYETTVPGRLSLGNIFSNFIYDEENSGNQDIELKDEDDHLYGWTFLTPSFLGLSKRSIDATLSLNENNIKSKSTIIARRVKNNNENHIQLSV